MILTRMVYDVIMNKSIKEDALIVPGGFSIKTASSKIEFDFENFEGWCIAENVLHAEHKNLDVDTFPESEKIMSEQVINNNFIFDEFFVFIENSETTPVAVKNLCFEFYDERRGFVSVPASLYLTNTATEALAF